MVAQRYKILVGKLSALQLLTEEEAPGDLTGASLMIYQLSGPCLQTCAIPLSSQNHRV